MRYLTLFLLLLGIVTSYSPEQLQQMYREKKIEYNMNFPTSRTEEKEHFLEFCNFANMVEKHNREDGSEWQGEINEFAMMTEAERNMYLGLNISAYMESLETISVDTRDEEIVDNEDDLMKSSESVDYSNKLPQVKGQGRCGSCWTFGAVAPLEYQVNRDSKTITALSEQQYLDCVAAGPNNGCKGGWSPNCYKWTRNHKNMLATQKDYPYKGKDMKCRKNVKSALTESGLVLKRTHVIPRGSSQLILKAVSNPKIGVLSAIVGVTKTFHSYKRGVYSGTKCYKPNHAVAIIGYGTLNGVPYWKIRNSWSRGWGEGGYMKIKRKGNMCAIEQYAHYPVIFREEPKTGSTTEEEVEREE